MSSRLTPARIALLYAAFAATWIVSSGLLLTFTVSDPSLHSQFEIAKGLAFVAFTGVLLYLLLRKWHASLLVERAKTDLLLRQFFDLPFIGMAVTSTETKHWIQFNDYLCSMLGYSRKELVEKTWADLTHPEDLASNLVKFERVVRGESDGFVMDKRFIRKDGAIVYATVDAKCVRKPDGAVDYLVTTVQDITARKQAELALQESESGYRSLIDNMMSGIAHCRMIFQDRVPVDFEYIKTNLNFEKITGLTDVAGRKVSEVIPGYCQDNPESLEVFGRVARTGEATRWEHYLQALDKWLAFSIYCPVPGEFVAVTDNITERKKAEAQLQLAAKVFEQNREGFVITDANRDIVMVNRAFTTITGYEEAEALGKNPRFLASGRHDPKFYQDMWQDINTNGYWHGEVWNRNKENKIFPEWLSISRVLDNSEKVTHYIGIFSDITEHKEAEERIQSLAHFDLLTGLPNRALFADRFNYALSITQRNNEQLALMYIDLDHFKNVNEALGQSVGDELLIEVAKRLKAAMRDEDTVSRQGGDEFILVLPGADADDAMHVAEKLLAIIARHYQIGQHELVVTPSIGIAMYPGDGDDFETLSKCADTAMYRAKADGRNNYRFFTPGMQARSARSLQLENALRRALERDELFLHYQPQVSLQDGRIIGAEALLRWQHSELGMVSPAEFIPIAESSGQILQIGEWVLRTAVKQLKTWMDEGMEPMVIAVNLSAVQFRHASLPKLITQILDEAQLPPQYLELELTEGVTMDNPLAAIAVMDNLHERGIRMSIDDFGTGYSSLNYLKKFKVYKLKIDQSFVRDISEDPEDKAIVSAIINMASSLGMQTIAEGVETAAQLAYLRLQGCDEVQGYYFSKPLAVAQFEMFVREIG